MNLFKREFNPMTDVPKGMTPTVEPKIRVFPGITVTKGNGEGRMALVVAKLVKVVIK
jgi:hypothetical protein